MQPNVWIVLVNYNGLEDTCACLESIAKIEYPRLTTVVVDNASQVDPRVVLNERFGWCRVMMNPVNAGWAGGNNVGLKAALIAGADLVVLLNNDTVVSPQLVERVVAAAAANPEIGILGPVINEMNEPALVQTDGVLFNHERDAGFFSREAVPLDAEQPAVREVDIVNGCCIAIRREVADRIGLIDERFFLIHEESDYCLRAREAGFRCGVIGQSLVWHKHSASFKRSGQRIQRYYDARNLHLLLRTHVGPHRPTHGASRGGRQSWLHYYRYAYWRYCLEREQGQDDAALAVLEGVADAWRGHYGPWARRQRLLVGPLRAGFEALRWWKGWATMSAAEAS
ncbi:MAG TPA: glycosyltransferase family 2 protein [Pirellulaceae bacterium]|nr:glycosyltransferase family 2 protein [Pirellulaceae bacterium]